MSGRWERLARPALVLAVIRVAAVPVFFAAERLADHPDARTGPFGPALVLFALYALATLVAAMRDRALASPPVLSSVDIVLIAALVATSGGPFSQLRYAFFLLPIGAAYLLNPRLTAALSAGSVALYALIAITYPDPTAFRPDAVGFETTQVLFLTWMGAAATMLSVALTRRARQVEELSASRGRLVAQALDAEDRARRRLADALHDDALQNLLAARQMLGSGNGAEELVAEGLEKAVVQIREAVFDLHPYLLDHAGLRAAINAVATEAGKRAGFNATVQVEPQAAGVHDQLIFAIARELLANCAKHAAATAVNVTVRRSDNAVELIVDDDGRGIDATTARRAALRGHIGLASCAERTEAIGGSLTFGAGPEGGTRVHASLPAPALVDQG